MKKRIDSLELIREKIQKKFFHLKKQIRKDVKLIKSFTIQKLIRKLKKAKGTTNTEDTLEHIKKIQHDKIAEHLFYELLKNEVIRTKLAEAFTDFPELLTVKQIELLSMESSLLENNQLKKNFQETITQTVSFLNKLLELNVEEKQGSKRVKQDPTGLETASSTYTGKKRIARQPSSQKKAKLSKVKEDRPDPMKSMFVLSLNSCDLDENSKESKSVKGDRHLKEEKKKNRPGQRARKRLNDIKYTPGLKTHQTIVKEKSVFRPRTSFKNTGKEEPSLHPSWEAKKKSLPCIKPFQGQKIVFD